MEILMFCPLVIKLQSWCSTFGLLENTLAQQSLLCIIWHVPGIVHGTCHAHGTIHGTCHACGNIHRTCHARGNIHGTCHALGSNCHGTLSGHARLQLDGRKDFSFISKAGYMQVRSLLPVSLVLLSHMLKLTMNSPCSPPPQSRHYKHEPPFPPCASLLKKMRPQRLLTRPPEKLQENGLLDSITNSSTQDKLMFKRQKASQSGSRHQKLSRTAETLMMMLAQIANVHSVLEKP